MAKNDIIIEIVDRQGIVDKNSVDYQPFGVKVLKLRVRLADKVDPKQVGSVWIHPKHYRRPDVKTGQWQAYGTADDDADLWVAWGAGDEKGFCASTKDRLKFIKVPQLLKAGKDYFIYLHLIHRPADPFTHTPGNKKLTIIATTEEKKDKIRLDANGEPLAMGQIEVTLTAPQGLNNPLRARWQWDETKQQSVITLAGQPGQPGQLPGYVARWWPTSQVTYKAIDDDTAAFLDQIKLVYERQGGDENHSRLTLLHGDTSLAIFDGDIRLPLHDYRLFSLEAFRFPDDYHLVFRLWFYWVHLGFTEEQLVSFVPADRQAAWQPEAKRVVKSLQGDLLSKPWRKREEVPDVERFDLVIAPDFLDYKFVGTDVHWQEYWAQIAKEDLQWGEPLRASIATLVDIPKVIANGREVPKVPLPVFDPLANGLCDLVNEITGHDCPRRGAGKLFLSSQIEPGVDYNICQGCGSHFRDEEERALGSFTGKHGPIMHNADILENAVSTDVLKG